jgi:hypothetical protein
VYVNLGVTVLFQGLSDWTKEIFTSLRLCFMHLVGCENQPHVSVQAKYIKKKTVILAHDLPFQQPQAQQKIQQ